MWRRLYSSLDSKMGAIWGKACSRWFQYNLRSRGVIFGSGVVIYGRPHITLAPQSLMVLGDNVVLCSDSSRTALGVTRPVILRTLESHAELRIGRDVGLSGTVICAATRITIGDNCLVGANVMIIDTDFHPLQPTARRHSEEGVLKAPIELEGNNFIGANSIILRGVTIGKDTVVGAGSVVTRSIPAGAIAAGNPARVIGFLDGKIQDMSR